MELERALFRVYERSIEGLGSEHGHALRPPRACNVILYGLLVCSGLLTAGVASLHRQFVDQAGCLGAIIEEQAALNGLLTPAPPPGSSSRRRQERRATSAGGVYNINNNKNDNSNATELVENGDGAGSAAVLGLSDMSADPSEKNVTAEEGSDDASAGLRPRRDAFVTLPSGAAIPRDILLQIRVGNGLLSGGNLFRPTGSADATGYADSGETIDAAGAAGTPKKSGENNTAEAGATDALENPASNRTAEVPFDFTFAFEPAVLLLPADMRREHGFPELNVSLPAECFGGAGTRALLRTYGGFSTPVINFLMFTFRSDGLLRGEAAREDWWWSADSMPPEGGRNFLDRLGLKLSALLRGVVAFVLLTTVTALIVRTLLSSGVIVMFPFFLCLERMDVGGVDLRILSLSYPWLGLPLEVLRRTNKPVVPFIMGHIMNVVVLYSMYNASQVAWNMWLYDKSISGAVQIWLYGLVMMWEYFALIFVRSAAAIRFFPRFVALVFLLYHVYLYYFTQAFFDMAALALFAVVLAGMIFVVLRLELPACSRGEITIDHPRAHFVELPWPAWGAALPPSWTLFIPPTATVRGVYSEGVPERPSNNNNNGGGNGNGAGGGSDAAAEGNNGAAAASADDAEAGLASGVGGAANGESGGGGNGNGSAMQANGAVSASGAVVLGAQERGGQQRPAGGVSLQGRGPLPRRQSPSQARTPGAQASPARATNDSPNTQVLAAGAETTSSAAGRGNGRGDVRDTREEERRPLRRRGSAGSGYYSAGSGGSSGSGVGDVELGAMRLTSN